jgi:hypothetical protein
MKHLKTFESYSELKVTLDGKTKMKISIDDEVLCGKFKNKKIKVKKISVNDKGDITINDKPFSKFRTNESFTEDVLANPDYLREYHKLKNIEDKFRAPISKAIRSNK